MWWLLCFLPLVEASIEAWFEKAKKISVNHFWTAVARGVIMVVVGLVIYWQDDRVLYWWQGTVLSFGIFITIFNYLYNALTGRPLLYLRAKGTDRLLAYVPVYFRWFAELIVLGSAITIYLNPFVIV